MIRVLTAIFLSVLVQAASAAPSVQEILSRNKQASGGNAWDDVRTITQSAHVATSGLSGTARSVTDVTAGYFSDSFELGAFKGANGYDGTTVWEVDTAGQVVVQGSDDQRQGAVDEAYRRSQSYWYADRMPAVLNMIGEKADAGRVLVGIRLLPNGGRPFDMWFDTRTWLLDHYEEHTARELRTTFVGDYRKVEGFLVAFGSRQTNGDTKYDTVSKVDTVVFGTALPKTAFAPPPPPRRDYALAGGLKSTVIPFRLINNHIYLQARLNGRPYQFLFDTGGMNVITPTVARELGLKPEGAVQARGTGEKSQEAGFTRVESLQVGDATLKNQTFVVIGLESFSDVEGVPVTGIIGYEVFKRFIVYTDYENAKVVLSEPEGFAYHGSGTRVDIRLNERTPEVQGAIDGLKGTFSLDTGARDSLTLSTPFVQENGLVARYAARLQAVTGWGVGGAARGWLARAKRLNLGPVAVDDTVIQLSQAKAGSMADAYLAGNIGAGVLKRFNIVWDYGHGHMFMERNRLDQQRDVWDRAGFWVNLSGGAFAVVDVTAGAPADRAGLKPGDRIVSVNGRKAVGGLSLPDFRLLKLGPVGSVLTLDVVRDGNPLTLSVKLADLV